MTWLRFFRGLRAANLMCAVVATVGAITAWKVGLSTGPWITGVLAHVVSWWFANRQYEREREKERWRLYRMTSTLQEFEEACRQVAQVIGTAFYGPMSQMADALRDIARALEPALRATFPPGTVQNPSDPSPTPRRTR